MELFFCDRSCISGSAQATIHAVEVSADPKSPRFGAGPREDTPGLYVDWAVEDSGLCKGDRFRILFPSSRIKTNSKKKIINEETFLLLLFSAVTVRHLPEILFFSLPPPLMKPPPIKRSWITAERKRIVFFSRGGEGKICLGRKEEIKNSREGRSANVTRLAIGVQQWSNLGIWFPTGSP